MNILKAEESVWFIVLIMIGGLNCGSKVGHNKAKQDITCLEVETILSDTSVANILGLTINTPLHSVVRVIDLTGYYSCPGTFTNDIEGLVSVVFTDELSFNLNSGRFKDIIISSRRREKNDYLTTVTAYVTSFKRIYNEAHVYRIEIGLEIDEGNVLISETKIQQVD